MCVPDVLYLDCMLCEVLVRLRCISNVEAKIDGVNKGYDRMVALQAQLKPGQEITREQLAGTEKTILRPT